MREIIVACILAVLLSLSGCSILEPYDRSMVGFWDQCVAVDAGGLTSFNQFGPTNLGWINWKRNIDCDESVKKSANEKSLDSDWINSGAKTVKEEPAKPRGAMATARQVLKPPPTPVMK